MQFRRDDRFYPFVEIDVERLKKHLGEKNEGYEHVPGVVKRDSLYDW